MRNHLVVWTIVISLAGGFSVMAAKAPPKTVTIKGCQKSKPPVTLKHEDHAKKHKIACKTCHHKGDIGQACSAAKCHAGKAEGKRLGCAEMSPSKNPYHVRCIGCHKKESKGPKGCSECHKK
jgi:hypothetical protein